MHAAACVLNKGDSEANDMLPSVRAFCAGQASGWAMHVGAIILGIQDNSFSGRKYHLSYLLHLYVVRFLWVTGLWFSKRFQGFRHVRMQVWGTGVRMEIIMRVMGLARVADTKVGNALVRGISGGERKRVTSAEMLVGPKVCSLIIRYPCILRV